HHFKLEPLVVFRHEKTPKGQIYVQLLGFSSAAPVFLAGAVWRAASALPGRGVVARRAACLPASAPLGRHGAAVTAIGRRGLRHRRGFGASGRAHRRSALAR
ncbi:hypothetical protein, partial [Burkholderia pseudomallei]